MVACQLPKLNARVRFPLPAPKISMPGACWNLERTAKGRGDLERTLAKRAGRPVDLCVRSHCGRRGCVRLLMPGRGLHVQHNFSLGRGRRRVAASVPRRSGTDHRRSFSCLCSGCAMGGRAPNPATGIPLTAIGEEALRGVPPTGQEIAAAWRSAPSSMMTAGN